MFGNGLGTSTQGGRQIGKHTARNWQEDGISRLGAEFGVPGSLCMLAALFGFGQCLWKALRALPSGTRASALQGDLLGVVAANAASFIISHQAYSGDPSAIAIVSLILGFVFAIPLLGEEAKAEAEWRARSNAAQRIAPLPASNLVAGSPQIGPTA